MVFTVTDLGGVFHLRAVGRSNDMYSGCTTAFNLFFMSGKPSAFNCVRCTLPEKSSGPYSSGSDFAFVLALQFFRRVHVLSVRLFNSPSAHMSCTVASQPRPSA